MIRPELIQNLKSQGRRIITLGIVLIVLGILAVAAPLAAGLALQWMLGILLIAAGATWLVLAFRARTWGSGLREGLLGLLTVIGGGLVLDRPLVSLALLTIVVGAYLAATGVMRVALAFHLKPLKGWGWTLLNGTISILFGIFVLVHWPSSALWLIGTFIGVDLVFAGVSLIRIGSLEKSVAAAAA